MHLKVLLVHNTLVAGLLIAVSYSLDAPMNQFIDNMKVSVRLVIYTILFVGVWFGVKEAYRFGHDIFYDQAVDNADARGGEPAYLLEEPADVVLGDGGGGLVHHDDAGVL